jgi:hypothetical protein
MFELRPNCECCNKDLLPTATDAMICTFECTFCRDCADNRLGGRCPNCGGNLVSRRPFVHSQCLRPIPPQLSASLSPKVVGSR